MKKLFMFLLIATLLLSTVSSLVACDDLSSPEATTDTTAADGGDDEPIEAGDLELTLNGDSYSVTGIGTYTGVHIVIPSTYNDKPVTTIAANAFKNCEKIKTVTIPDGIKKIEARAFEGCVALTSVIIPDSVELIERYAFYECEGIQSITVPFIGEAKEGTENTHFGYIFGAKNSSNHKNLVPASLKTIVVTGGNVVANSAFNNCESVESITLPDSVTSIGASSFRNCNSLKYLVLPFVGPAKNAVENTHFGYIFGAATYEENATVVPSTLKTVILTTAESIADYAFATCDDIEVIALPDTLKSIGQDAFLGCKNLVDVMIPGGVESIGDKAFESCHCIKVVTFADGLKVIGNKMFYYCYNLTNVVIPASVTTIGDAAFYGATGLKNVYYMGTASDWANNVTIEGDQNFNITDPEISTVYYYSETEPTEEGNFWHYVDGVATEW